MYLFLKATSPYNIKSLTPDSFTALFTKESAN